MAEYELVREIKNLCPNNQMRDVFFEEVETDDPVEYIRKEGRFPIMEVTRDANGDLLIITGDTKGYFIRYTFTE